MPIVDMNGWDTISAITYRDVNAAIAAQGASPTSFNQAASDGSASASGTFGQWTLTTGGAGPDVMMSVPITGGNVNVGGTDYPVTATTASVLVRGNFLPQPGAPNMQQLTMQEVASVNEVQPPQSNFTANAVLGQLLQEWLNENLQSFNQVFAVVDMNAQFTSEGLTWLLPSHTGYAVAEPPSPTLDNSVFAVLCLIDGNTDTSGLDFQTSAHAIPTGHNAGFVVSPRMFLKHMMLLATQLMFQGNPTENDFTIDNDGTRITNINPLVLTDTQLENGAVVKPAVPARNFAIEVKETELVITGSDMTFDSSPGITIHLNYTSRSTVSFDTSQDILDLIVTFQEGGGSVEVSEGIRIVEIVTGAVAIVLGALSGIGGALSKSASEATEEAVQAAKEAEAAAQTAAGVPTVAADVNLTPAQMAAINVSAAAGIISGTPTAVAQIGARLATLAKFGGIAAFALGTVTPIIEIVAAVAKGNYDSVPKITELTDNALGRAVMWPEGVPRYTLASAQLNGALQFGLDRTT